MTGQRAERAAQAIRTSPRVIEAHLRAVEAARLRALGMTWDAIAAQPQANGEPLFNHPTSAQKAVQTFVERGRLFAWKKLGLAAAAPPPRPKRRNLCEADVGTQKGLRHVRALLADVVESVTFEQITASTEQTEALIRAVQVLAQVEIVDDTE